MGSRSCSAPRAHSKTYKVPRRPYESARLDAELKVRLLGGKKGAGPGTGEGKGSEVVMRGGVEGEQRPSDGQSAGRRHEGDVAGIWSD